MTKSEFFVKINPYMKKYHFHLEAGDLAIVPDKGPSGRYGLCDVKEIPVSKITTTLYTQKNQQELIRKIKESRPIFAEWEVIRKEWIKTLEYREWRRQKEIRALAIRAGLEVDEHGSYSEDGDTFYFDIHDYVWRKPELRKCHACGKYLAVVEVTRVRRYSNSSKYYPSIRRDLYLIGTNENVVPFCHQIPQEYKTISKALAWIWNWRAIEARQGDVAIVPSHLKHVKGQRNDIRIVDSHRVEGEIYRNGSIHVRNARIYHTKKQHPDITVGDEWKLIVIGRRSQRGMSSAD